MRTVLLEDARRGKLAQLVADHVFGDEHGIEKFAVVDEEGVADEIRVTIERRDQVLIGFFTPELFILSIFSRRWPPRRVLFLVICSCVEIEIRDSSIGSFSADSRSAFLLRLSPLHDETVARLVLGAGLETLRQLAPRADRMMASAAALALPWPPPIG